MVELPYVVINYTTSEEFVDPETSSSVIELAVECRVVVRTLHSVRVEDVGPPTGN